MKIINTQYFLHKLYLEAKTPEEINSLFNSLFTELGALLCSTFTGVSIENIEFFKTTLAESLDKVKEQCLLFDVETYLDSTEGYNHEH